MPYRNQAARSRAALAATSGPVNSVRPAITGTKQVGQTLTCSTGTWSKSPTFTYQWLRNGQPISGATASTRVLQVADQGALMSCRVTAKKSGITRSATSAQTTAIAA
jgi:hypothetical protein